MQEVKLIYYVWIIVYSYFEDGMKTLKDYQSFIHDIASKAQEIKSKQDEEKKQLYEMRTLLKGGSNAHILREKTVRVALDGRRRTRGCAIEAHYVPSPDRASTGMHRQEKFKLNASLLQRSAVLIWSLSDSCQKHHLMFSLECSTNTWFCSGPLPASKASECTARCDIFLE